MGVGARVILDSVSPAGARITTLEATMHRFVLAEFNTHCMLARNSASSRAIPTPKMLARHEADPAMPVHWGANQAGMQAKAELAGWRRAAVEAIWRVGLAMDRQIVRALNGLGLHKQVANRRLELGSFHTVIVTATEWDNFMNLRCHPDAQPEMQAAAVAMREARDRSLPVQRHMHLPLVFGYDFDELYDSGIQTYEALAQISSGRCARVSYLTHEGKRAPAEDATLANRLQAAGHMSPFEHPAEAFPYAHTRSGKFKGWEQYRKTIPGEAVFNAR